MVSAEEHAQVITGRDAWAMTAREVQAALEKLKDRSAEMIRTAGRLMRFAWSLMIVMVVFAGAIIVAGAIRASARECPPVSQPPMLLERP